MLIEAPDLRCLGDVADAWVARNAHGAARWRLGNCPDPLWLPGCHAGLDLSAVAIAQAAARPAHRWCPSC
jgi:hypothetical protein